MYLYDPGKPMPMGLPRPLAEAPDGKLRPVPWSQRRDEWGKVDDQEGHFNASGMPNCLVCGVPVETGVVILSVPEAESYARFDGHVPEVVTEANLHNDYVADHGPLHDGCAKLTLAHCKTIRELRDAGTVKLRPYRREVV